MCGKAVTTLTWHSYGRWLAVGRMTWLPRPSANGSWWNSTWGRAASGSRWHIGPVSGPAPWTRVLVTSCCSCRSVPWTHPRTSRARRTVRKRTPPIRWYCWPVSWTRRTSWNAVWCHRHLAPGQSTILRRGNKLENTAKFSVTLMLRGLFDIVTATYRKYVKTALK